METTHTTAATCTVTWQPKGTLDDLFQIRDETHSFQIAIVNVHASWNPRFSPSSAQDLLTVIAQSVATGVKCGKHTVSILLSDDDESSLIGDDGSIPQLPIPPSELPALAVVCLHPPFKERTLTRYIPVRANDINKAMRGEQIHVVVDAAIRLVRQLENDLQLPVAPDSCNTALRIFIAGDKSSVGKSSVCLGIIGSIVMQGLVAAADLAYIKPATQSESTQLIEQYCKKHDIECVPIGPLVYYRGFTRAFLAGETQSTEELLELCGRAVDRIARRKKIVLIDGVGFPAVGSICGTDNASVAKACSYPVSNNDDHNDPVIIRKPMGVILVGGSGVGAAVDAFNLNASYFDAAGVPVLGSIFNKLSETGYYSLQNCRTQVSAYFEKNKEQLEKDRRPYGFVPLFPSIVGEDGMEYVDEFLRIFDKHVDVQAVLTAAEKVKGTSDESLVNRLRQKTSLTATWKLNRGISTHASSLGFMPSRQTIEQAAIKSGAAKSA